MKKSLLAFSALCLCLAGCKTDNSVIANTGTVLGIDISQNPANQMYHLKLGYARAETAYVPTNKGTNSMGRGAQDTAEVLMEIKMTDIFKGGGVYQRLAVGKEAVKQPGAMLMFARDSQGELSSNALNSIIKSVPQPDSDATAVASKIVAAYNASGRKAEYDLVAKQFGYWSFAEFAIDPAKTPEQSNKVMQECIKRGLIQ